MAHRFQKVGFFDAPPEQVFDLSLDIDFHQQSFADSDEKVVGGVSSGLIGLGEDVTWRAKHFGIWWKMTSTISELDRPHRFVDQQKKGPFRKFWHEHLFELHEGGTRMTDNIELIAPLGPLGTIAERVVLNRYMEKLIELRNDELGEELRRRNA